VIKPGTVCVIVAPPGGFAVIDRGHELIGRWCTTTSGLLYWYDAPYYMVDIPLPGFALGIYAVCLRPIAPPGDPDAERTPERLPEELAT
jgi:hypothetical protein